MIYTVKCAEKCILTKDIFTQKNKETYVDNDLFIYLFIYLIYLFIYWTPVLRRVL